MSERTTNRLLLLLTAVLFSTGGAAIKATSLAGWQVASFRSAIAAATILALVPAARRSWSPRVVLVAFAYSTTMVSFVLANKLTTAANAVYLQSTAPIFVLPLSVWLLREKVRRTDVLLAGAVALGLVVFFIGREKAVASAPDPMRGNLLGVLSGIAWAFTVTGLRWLGRLKTAGNPAVTTVAAGNLLAALVCLPMALPASNVGWRDALVLVYLGVFQIGLAYFLLTRAIRHVPAFETATLLLVEPALNPVWAWLAQGERPGAWALAGGALILGASFANAWWRENRRAALQ
jgi:drug/metabolite transporter (DMT)-like permease